MVVLKNNYFYDLPKEIQDNVYKVGLVCELKSFFCSPRFKEMKQNIEPCVVLGLRTPWAGRCRLSRGVSNGMRGEARIGAGWRYSYSTLGSDYCSFHNNLKRKTLGPAVDGNYEMLGLVGCPTRQSLFKFLEENNQKTDKTWKKQKLLAATMNF